MDADKISVSFLSITTIRSEINIPWLVLDSGKIVSSFASSFWRSQIFLFLFYKGLDWVQFLVATY